MNRRLRPWLTYAFQRGRREARDLVLRRGASDPKTLREDVALRYLKGDGIGSYTLTRSDFDCGDIAQWYL